MVKQSIVLTHLYPKEMNIYGDTGNVLVLKKRLEWRGVSVDLRQVGIGDELPKDSDIIVSGGGQDKGQISVQDDLLHKAIRLHDLANDGAVMLVICGTYQLFGHRFITNRQKEIKGIGIFDMETVAGDKRLIGNVVSQSEWGELVGYENHSGKTFLAEQTQRLGTIVNGAGNNGQDQTEGAIHHNVFGTYLHGPILPKNPMLADELIMRALKRKFGDDSIDDLNDQIAFEAAERAAKRPR